VAGLRTHILIAMGSTFLMCLSIWLPQVHPQLQNGDPGRIAAQVVSGIGFLGAGAMIRLGTSIRGLTTAASLWITAAIGMGVGAGMFGASAAATVMGLVALYIFDIIEKKVFPPERTKTFVISYKNSEPDITVIENILKDSGFRILAFDMDHNLETKITTYRFFAGISGKIDLQHLGKLLEDTGEIIRLESQESY
jgi:putative Mg2+ transporter-C (MgtC) family protein